MKTIAIITFLLFSTTNASMQNVYPKRLESPQRICNHGRLESLPTADDLGDLSQLIAILPTMNFQGHKENRYLWTRKFSKLFSDRKDGRLSIMGEYFKRVVEVNDEGRCNLYRLERRDSDKASFKLKLESSNPRECRDLWNAHSENNYSICKSRYKLYYFEKDAIEDLNRVCDGMGPAGLDTLRLRELHYLRGNPNDKTPILVNRQPGNLAGKSEEDHLIYRNKEGKKCHETDSKTTCGGTEVIPETSYIYIFCRDRDTNIMLGSHRN